MVFESFDFKDLQKQIVSGEKKIIIFGAGMIGKVCIPSYLKENGCEDRIAFYVDNDSGKWGKNIVVYGKEYKILSPVILKNTDAHEYIIVVSISRFSDINTQLDEIINTSKVKCFLFPAMCILNYKTNNNDIIKKDFETPIIPKIIHYMWLGKKEIPQSLQYCIDSWKRLCPDYEIRCWNEDNYDISKNKYMLQAYENGALGFVPDYARLDILYNYGGIYLDTDVELVKNLDDMLYQSAFCCVEKWQTINFGGGSGAIKGSKGIKKLLDERESLLFIDENGWKNMNTCGYYDTLTLQKYGYKMNGNVQKVLDINVYPFEVFHPYDYASGQLTTSVNTHGIHHFNGGWLDDKMRDDNRRTSEEFDRIGCLCS